MTANNTNNLVLHLLSTSYCDCGHNNTLGALDALLSSATFSSKSNCLLLHDSKTGLPQFEEKGNFLFNTVITLTRPVSYSASAILVYCSTILLNIVLVYHRQVVISRQETLLVKSERFYERVIEISPSGDKVQDCGGTGIMTKLAAMNNLSQIQSARGGSLPNRRRRLQALCPIVKKGF
jgi:hypothetical protein